MHNDEWDLVTELLSEKQLVIKNQALQITMLVAALKQSRLALSTTTTAAELRTAIALDDAALSIAAAAREVLNDAS